MNETRVSVQLYSNKYGNNAFTTSILNANFGFELSLESDIERTRRILGMEQVLELKAAIEKALVAYDEAMLLTSK